MAVWDDVVPASERKIYEVGGWGKRMGFGAKPAIIVVDVNYDFVGDKPEPIMQSIKRWFDLTKTIAPSFFFLNT